MKFASSGARDLFFFESSSRRICEQVVREFQCGETGAREGNGHPRRVNRDPAPTPFLSHYRGGSPAARWVKDQVAGVTGHEDASLDHLGIALYNVGLVRHEAACGVVPRVDHGEWGEVVEGSHVPEGVARSFEPARAAKALDPLFIRLPDATPRTVRSTVELDSEGPRATLPDSRAREVVECVRARPRRKRRRVVTFTPGHWAAGVVVQLDEAIVPSAWTTHTLRAIKRPIFGLSPILGVPDQVVSSASEKLSGRTARLSKSDQADEVLCAKHLINQAAD